MGESDYLTIYSIILFNLKSLTSLVFERIKNDDLRSARKLLLPLLHHESDEIRKLAVFYFTRKLTNKKLEQLLDQYLSSSTYYYNVIHYLDRAIYAPRVLKSSFRWDL